MKIIAHRGASADAPENTLAAFRLAWEENADGVEFDIQLTADGQIVVIHDDDTRRTTGQPGAVCSWKLRDLQRLDSGSWKGAKWRGERIPTLEEALDAIPAGKLAFIEIKCGAEILPELRRVIQNIRFNPSRVVFVGFSIEVMALAKRTFDTCLVLWNVEPQSVANAEWVRGLCRQVRQSGIGGLGLGIGRVVNVETVRIIREEGQQLFVWTVDDAKTARRTKDIGVEFIATNKPGWIRKQIGSS